MHGAYSGARQQHGASELLDDVVSAKPQVDHTRYRSPEELKEHGLQHVRDAVEVLKSKATPEELEDYRRFVLTLTEKGAGAHPEDGDDAVSEAGRAAVAQTPPGLGAGCSA